jgi:tRNA(fMet)-specific endonuclease VapC
MYGAANSQKREANEHKIALFISASRLQLLDFVDGDATEAAELRAHLKASDAPIGPYDLLIAAQARRAQATLITANTSEFSRVPGLTVVNWST